MDVSGRAVSERKRGRETGGEEVRGEIWRGKRWCTFFGVAETNLAAMTSGRLLSVCGYLYQV